MPELRITVRFAAALAFPLFVNFVCRVLRFRSEAVRERRERIDHSVSRRASSRVLSMYLVEEMSGLA